MEIKVDTREGKTDLTTLELMQRFEPETREGKLDIGDIAYKNVRIELKTIVDFVSSIMDERFINQLYNMFINSELICYYFIYGDWADAFKYSKINPNALLGAIASIVSRYKVNVCTFPNKEFAIYTAYKVIEKSFDGKDIKPRTFKVTSDERAVNMLRSGAPRFQEKAAIGALEEFGSVKNVVNATKDDLLKVEHLGEKTAEEFLRTINFDFKKKAEFEADFLEEFDIEGDMIKNG